MVPESKKQVGMVVLSQASVIGRDESDLGFLSCGGGGGKGHEYTRTVITVDVKTISLVGVTMIVFLVHQQ